MEVSEYLTNYKLGEPKSGKDQRFNFFIKNPHMISDDIYNNMASQLQEQFGINSKEDIGSFSVEDSVSPTYQESKQQNVALIDFLKGFAGDALLKNLQENINSQEVHMWVASGWKDAIKSRLGRETSLEKEIGGAEGDTTDFRKILDEKAKDESIRLRDQEVSEEEKADASDRIASLIRVYLQDIRQDMENIKESSVNKYMDDIGDQVLFSDTDKEREKAKKKYEDSEKVSIYVNSYMRELEDMLNQIGTVDSTGNRYVYKNNFGRLVIDRKFLNAIFGSYNPLQETEQNKYDSMVYRYIKDHGRENMWQPAWGTVVKSQLLKKGYADIAKLKKDIIAIDKKNKKTTSTTDKLNYIFEKLTFEESTNQKLTEIVGQTQNPENDRKRKKKFIKMTLELGEESAERFQDLADEKAWRSFKAQLGYKYAPILGYVEGIKNNFKKESLRAFTDIFGTHSRIKNLGSLGRPRNEIIKDRTNTDLYYSVRKEELPDNLKILNPLALDKSHLPFFQKYEEYLSRIGEVNKKDNAIKKIDTETQELKKDYNQRISSKMNKDPELKMIQMLESTDPFFIEMINDLSRHLQQGKKLEEHRDYISYKKRYPKIKDFDNLVEKYNMIKRWDKPEQVANKKELKNRRISINKQVGELNKEKEKLNKYYNSFRIKTNRLNDFQKEVGELNKDYNEFKTDPDPEKLDELRKRTEELNKDNKKLNDEKKYITFGINPNRIYGFDQVIKKLNNEKDIEQLRKDELRENLLEVAEEKGIAGLNFASNSTLNLLYASFINTKNKLYNLEKMKNIYDNVKFASTNVNSINSLINKIIEDYNQTFKKLIGR